MAIRHIVVRPRRFWRGPASPGSRGPSSLWHKGSPSQGLHGVVKVPGDFSALHQQLPADFLGRVPLIEGTTGAEVDPNRYVYFSQGEKLYRVAKEPDCGRPGTDCTPERLRVQEIFAGGTSLEIPGAPIGFGNRLTLDSPRVFRVSPGPGVPPMVLRERPIAWLWPQDAGLKLGDVPPEGKVISGEEFEKHKALYASILKVWTYGGRLLNFIDGGFQYAEVHLCQVKPGSAADECEDIP